MLIFLAGYEIEFGKVRGDALRRSVRAWLIALGLGLATGVLLGGGYTKGVFIGVALTSTALGTVLPVLRDAGGPSGRADQRLGVVVTGLSTEWDSTEGDSTKGER